MRLKPDTLGNALKLLNAIKARGKAGFLTNYFRQEMAGGCVLTAATDSTVLFANDEYDFHRLYFFTTDLADFNEVLAKLEFEGDVVAGCLDKSPNQRICDSFRQSGFENMALFQRMTHNKLPSRPLNASLAYATPEDAGQIHQDLFRTFNKFTDHLPDMNRLLEYIAKQFILVNRKGGRVLGAVIFQILGRQVNFNYFYNSSPEALDALRLQSNFYGLMHQRGIRSGFLWVNSTNQGVIRMHQAFGWRFDGLKDCFYLKRFAAK